MNARQSQLTGRLRLRHLMEHAEAVDEEMSAERTRFQKLAREDSAPRVVSAFNLFQTPPDLAAYAVSLLNVVRGRVLEPSAGLGRIYRAVRDVSDCPITLVEQSPECCRELYIVTEQDRDCRLIQGDFLACDSDRIGLFDCIVMNPPFKMGTDVKHILHALTLLNAGGRLVSVCAAGPKQRKVLQPLGEWIDLPAGTFKGEGTNVAAAVLIVDM